MDMEKTGKFLAALRHEKGFTQEELGERIGVTNKTVSRWETGKYLPLAEMLVILSELYGITINEILSGRRLNEVEYKEAAEENIKNVLSASSFDVKEKLEFFKAKWKKDHVFELVIEFINIVVLTIIGFYLYEETMIIAAVILVIWGSSINNRMMAYAENRAFDVEKKLSGNSTAG